MEALLNLVWLLLTLPALWLWRKASPCSRSRRPRSSLLILGCLLILLFPVISVSDDLQAMRPEVEEAATRDGTRNSAHGKLSLPTKGGVPACPLLAARPVVFRDRTLCGAVVPFLALKPALELMPAHVGRAPPRSFVG